LQRGWSQETLAQLSGLNVRTIQRIERGQRAGLETLQALAAVLEVNLTDLQEPDMRESETPKAQGEESDSVESDEQGSSSVKLTPEERKALRYVRDLKAFYQHLGFYVLIVAALAFLNLMTSPQRLWFPWAAFGWGIGVAIHGLTVHEIFNFIGPEWERRQVEKRLGRKL
jgi:transcriptional regulator with XRE-family HTH domain